MKALLLLVSFMMAAPAFGGFCGNKQASASTVADAQANPNRYHWDDGGNISFGNGFFTRRFNFKGQPKVCRSGNYIYAGVRKKCVKPIYNGDEVTGCSQYKTVELKTQMTGTKQVCTSNDDDNGPCKKYSTVKFKRGPQVKIMLFRKSQMGSNNDCSGFKGYVTKTIPVCND